MNRRQFLKSHAAAAAALATIPLVVETPAQTSATGGPIKSAGIRMIPIDGGKYKVWTKKIGSGKIKMLLLHGGPGLTHEYFECFEDFLPQEGIEFYYYDQLGSHYSDQPNDVSLWTLPRFLEEVEQVRKALGLDKFYLYGHSWGGMLGIEYALKYPQHLKGLILSDMTASSRSYERYANEILATLSAADQATLKKYAAAGDYDNPEYQKIMIGTVYAQHLCRLDPWPEPVDRTGRHINNQVYNTMQGPNEYVITGNFKDWDRWADLHRITTPTLTICGRYDEMDPKDIEREAQLIPNARFALCPNGSHLCMWDDQQTYFKHLIKFVRDNERGVRIN